jgi:Fic family protein
MDVHIVTIRGGKQEIVYTAPPGGRGIKARLKVLLAKVNSDPKGYDPFDMHCEYEMLHPFTDGNGRSGRLLWAWHMLKRGESLSLGFLHQFYYQALRHQQQK